MLQFILDTNICIYVLKKHPAELRDKFNGLAESLCISSITMAELCFGAQKSARQQDNLKVVEQFAARLDVLPFGTKAAVHYGQLRADLERRGKPCGAHDMLIGAHARSEGLVVVTNNMRVFKNMPGVRVENWV